ncbi:hypothetical protein AgCh_035468 [Apium graveolens]
MKEHRQKRELSSIDEQEQYFMHVMLSVMESDPSAQITDTSIKGACLSLLLGGYDAKMVTLTWVVTLLLNNRHLLRKVQNEFDKHVERDRQVNEAVADFHISARTNLFVNLWKLHHDPRIWSDPMEFQPERFFKKHVDVHKRVSRTFLRIPGILNSGTQLLSFSIIPTTTSALHSKLSIRFLITRVCGLVLPTLCLDPSRGCGVTAVGFLQNNVGGRFEPRDALGVRVRTRFGKMKVRTSRAPPWWALGLARVWVGMDLTHLLSAAHPVSRRPSRSRAWTEPDYDCERGSSW